MPADTLARRNAFEEALRNNPLVCVDFMVEERAFLCALHPAAGIMCPEHLRVHVERSPEHAELGCDVCDGGPLDEVFLGDFPLTGWLVRGRTTFGHEIKIEGHVSIYAVLSLCARCRRQHAGLIAASAR